MISTRTLAITRYKRNHELMEEVFKRAAFSEYSDCRVHPPVLTALLGALVTPSPPAPAYSIFDKAELESKAVSGYEQRCARRKHADRLLGEVTARSRITTSASGGTHGATIGSGRRNCCQWSYSDGGVGLVAVRTPIGVDEDVGCLRSVVLVSYLSMNTLLSHFLVFRDPRKGNRVGGQRMASKNSPS